MMKISHTNIIKRKKKMKIIHCWSAPRSRSTALLYSFEARDATIALDEPLYRRWLEEKINDGESSSIGISRPYADSFLKGEAPDGHTDDWRWEREKQCLNERLYHAIKSLIDKGNEHEGCIFLKQMAKFAYLFNFNTNWEAGDKNSEANQWKDKSLKLISESNIEIQHYHVILIRDPVSCVGSWVAKSSNVHNNNLHHDEVGVNQLLEVYSKVTENQAVVIDSDDLAAYPSKALQDLCVAMGIEYSEQMLTWEAGQHKCDGPWAKWWYHDVWKSSGWDLSNGRTQQQYRTISTDILPTIRMAMPAYNFLSTLTAAHKQRNITTPPSGKLFEDPRNEHVLVYVGTPSTPERKGKGRIVPRDMANISPFDSSVQGGDACWEGLRVYNGSIFHLDHHLDRLFRSAKALGFENVHTRDEVIDAIFRVLAANGMRNGAHMRLTLTRGEKCTSSMNPLFNVYGTTLIILPEFKPTEGATTYDNSKGVKLITAGTCRRSPPSTLDNKVHHNNMIQNILPKIQANLAGAADSLMLDIEGFVAETNATNLFLVRRDRGELDGKEFPVLVTPTGDHCLPGITRDTVLILARELEIKTEVKRVSLSEFYCASEVFTTGTMGELTPVIQIDGRQIGDKTTRGVVTEQLQKAYKEAVATRLHWSTEIPPFV